MQIMTQEQDFLNARTQFNSLVGLMSQSTEQHRTIGEVEQDLWQGLLAVGKSLLQGFVSQHGTGDLGETFGHDGRTLNRLPTLHLRRYVSIFGPIQISRTVYGTRETQKHEICPLDAQLNLPESPFSYVLQGWDQSLCVQNSYDRTRQTISDILGIGQSVNSLEHMTRAMHAGVESFHQSQSPPDPEGEGDIIVVTVDGKGIPMRRGEDEEGSSGRRKKGEKANKKRMACVGAVYTIDSFPRTVEEVVNEIQREEKAKQRPTPCNKRVRAELTKVIDGEEINGKETTFDWMAEEIEERNPDGSKPVVCLMDGEKALNKRRKSHLPTTIFILDLFHAMEKIWEIAYCLFKEGSDDANEFVTDKLTGILNGKVGRVVGGIKQMATKRGLNGKKMKTLHKACQYLLNNRDYMKYDVYLAAGYPIGSGVIEGTCRYFVKDRMELSGMRWVIEGAQAMLSVRAIYLNGEWDVFQAHRIEDECHRLYPYRGKIIENLQAAA